MLHFSMDILLPSILYAFNSVYFLPISVSLLEPVYATLQHRCPLAKHPICLQLYVEFLPISASPLEPIYASPAVKGLGVHLNSGSVMCLSWEVSYSVSYQSQWFHSHLVNLNSPWAFLGAKMLILLPRGIWSLVVHNRSGAKDWSVLVCAMLKGPALYLCF